MKNLKLIKMIPLLIILFHSIYACDLPDLPSNLNYLSSSFDITHHLEISGRFLIPQKVLEWEFITQEDSWFRISIEPKLHNIHIKLIKEETLFDFSEAVKDESAMISRKLIPGNYHLSFEVTMQWKFRDKKNLEDCKSQNLFLNLAVHPYSKLDQLIPSSLDEYQNGYPELADVKNSITDFLPYKNTQSTYFIDSSAVLQGDSTLKTYDFILPEPTEELTNIGLTGLWKLTFTIHSDFLTGGGLGIYFAKTKKPLSKFSKLPCISTGSCVFGKRSEKNSVSIYSIFNSGEFSISLFYKSMINEEKEMLDTIGGKIPYSMHMNVEPIFDKEDRFNCEASHIPHSLNSPGLLDFRGFLRFSDLVIADLSVKKQITEFEIFESSIFRLVIVEPSGIDIDVSLYNSEGILIESSDAVGRDEGILAELEEGKYYIEYTFLSSMMTGEHIFCETFLLEIGISPESATDLLAYHLGLERSKCNANTASLKDAFEKLSESLNSVDTKVQIDTGKENYYKVPINSINIGEEEVFRTDFSLKIDALAYIDIYSDFVINDLTIAIEKKKPDVHDPETIKLDKDERRSFKGKLTAGDYNFIIKTGPTAKKYSPDTGDYETASNIDQFKVIPSCAAFQIRIIIVGTSDSKIKNSPCDEEGIDYIVSSLNTMDKLGVAGTPANFLPTIRYFSKNIKAQSPSKPSKQEISFAVESDSILRVLAETDQSAMELSLKQDGKTITFDKSNSERTPPFYSITHLLEPDKFYILELTYHPTETRICHTYSLLIEIALNHKNSFYSCEEKLPNSAVIQERLLDSGDIFKFSNDEGYSSLIEEEKFCYQQKNEPFLLEVPFSISYDAAMITASLQASFIQAGIVLQIEKDGEIIQWGSYEASHLFRIPSFPLSKGNYTLVYKELLPSESKNQVSFSTSVLIEDVSLWDDISSMIRKTETCPQIDQPSSLNLVGQLESGNLHWHKTLEMDVFASLTIFRFIISEDSIIRVFIVPQDDIIFEIRLMNTENPDSLINATISDPSQGLHTRIIPGPYMLEISYTGDSSLSLKKSCPSYEMDLQIITINQYYTLTNKISCDFLPPLPSSFDGLLGIFDRYMMKDIIDHSIFMGLNKDTEITASIAYENSVTGYLSMEILDEKNSIAKSIGIENYSEIFAKLTKGKYVLRIILSKNIELSLCWPLQLSIQSTETLLDSVCLGDSLPSSLLSSRSKKFGGPQLGDGSVSFYGTFLVNPKIRTETIKLFIPQSVIGRIVTISHNSGMFIESAIYKEKNLAEPVVYSKNRLATGSLIVALSGQASPYFLVLTYIIDKAEPCLTFDLKIAIETVVKVKNILECMTNNDNPNSLLPKPQINFGDEKEIYGSDMFSVQDSWIIGEKQNFPPGIVSNGEKGSNWVYEIKMNIKRKATVSIETNYNFLTNDMNFQILKEKKVIAKSSWEIITDEQMDEIINFSSIISNEEIDPGLYTIRIKQGLGTNFLVQRYDETKICLPFAFFIEYLPIENKVAGNSLSMVDPDKNDVHNLNEDLVLMMIFQDPIDKTLPGLKKSVYLLSETDEKVVADSMGVSTSYLNKLKLTFSSSKLKPKTCYFLKIDEAAISSALLSDGLEHKYCTMGCLCNPKSNAICSETFSCLCSSPYTGNDCFSCVEGFYMIENECVQQNIKDSPSIKSVKFEDPEPFNNKKYITLSVSLTSAPYNNNLKSITEQKHQEDMINAFIIINMLNGDTIKAISARPINKGLTKWELKFETEKFTDGYNAIKQNGGILFDVEGRSFALDCELPFFQYEKEEIECGNNGKVIDGTCVCNLGYFGEKCELCAEGYFKNKSGECAEVKNNENGVVISNRDKNDTGSGIAQGECIANGYIKENDKCVRKIKQSEEKHENKSSWWNYVYLVVYFIISVVVLCLINKMRKIEKTPRDGSIEMRTGNIQYEEQKLIEPYPSRYDTKGKYYD
ncbi:unnamed protein product [Blepharisma stoltei]|uniref:EGF-like domain-containing protein n=1 Tax=Blepharisma stoltei TaxID=1481888 RepID=A0AAU9JMS3_9CILI|nr:unnamed protein product [Blepharisma stoltei]